jgi:hypothetical protein
MYALLGAALEWWHIALVVAAGLVEPSLRFACIENFKGNVPRPLGEALGSARINRNPAWKPFDKCFLATFWVQTAKPSYG